MKKKMMETYRKSMEHFDFMDNLRKSIETGNFQRNI